MSGNILEIRGVNRIYSSDDTKVTALSDINLSVKKGEFISLIGSSGCPVRGTAA